MERNEAIEVIKKNYPHIAESGSQFETALRILIPELKESEGERIRKEIIEYMRHQMDRFSDAPNVLNKYEKWIAWFEKQCEQKSIIDIDKMVDEFAHTEVKGYGMPAMIEVDAYRKGVNDVLCLSLNLDKQGEQHPKFRIGDTIKKESTGDIVTIIEIDLKNREYRLSNTGFIPFKYEHLWELVEQKPADKVEPKFHKGDWVIDKQGIVHQIANVIENVTNHTYAYDIVGGSYFNDNTEGVRLWTIQDAKDGDVLADYRAILLFRSIGNRYWENAISYYTILETNLNNRFSISDDEEYWGKVEDCELKPASEEQRDFFFQKMKEAGYEWDAEKKELKNIEQKPAWSEEDEYLLDETIKHLETLIRITKKQGSAYSDEVKYYQRDIDWLKSLKDRYTWKPSEEMLEALYRVIPENVMEKSEDEMLLDKLYQGLKYGKVLSEK